MVFTILLFISNFKRVRVGGRDGCGAKCEKINQQTMNGMGNGLWLSWKSGRFQLQRSAV